MAFHDGRVQFTTALGDVRTVQSRPVRSIVEVATAAAMDVLPQRLSVHEMEATADVSLWSL
jgi:hypothetical protein